MSNKVLLLLLIGILTVPAALLIYSQTTSENPGTTVVQSGVASETTQPPNPTSTQALALKAADNPHQTSPPATTTHTPPPTKPADLTISVSNPEYGLCCGMIPTKMKITATPTIWNKGDLTAHDVSITFEMFTLPGKRIALSGKNQITRLIGDMAAGEKITETIEFTFGIKDSYDLQKNGVRAVYNIHSEEADKRLVDEFTVDVEHNAPQS